MLPDLVHTRNDLVAAVQRPTIANIEFILGRLGVEPVTDLMTRRGRIKVDGALIGGDRTLVLVKDACGACRINSRDVILEVIDMISADARYHPFEDWLLAGPTWDGADRIGPLAATVPVEVEDAEAWPRYLRRWLVQVVACGREWQADGQSQKSGCIVLQGAQGIGKTRWVGSLLPDQFVRLEASLHFNRMADKEVIANVTRSVICELAELDTTFGQSDKGRIKTHLSSTEDVYRAPFARSVIEWPRCTAYIATVNRPDIFDDETGARRFWPVAVAGPIDFEHDVNIDQLWAQANALYEDGTAWWLDDNEERRRISRLGSFEAHEPVTAWLEQQLGQWADRDVSKVERAPRQIEAIIATAPIAKTARTYSVAGAWLTKMFGRRGRYTDANGHRVPKSWLVPVGDRTSLKLVGDQGGDTSPPDEGGGV